MRDSVVEIEVRYAETDQMGIVHHSNYLPWFEVARTRLCERTGKHYADIEAAGYYLVVTGASLVYRRGARYGETVAVHCRLEWLGTRALRFAYEVRCGDERLASGSTDHVWVDRSTGRHCRIPAAMTPGFLSLSAQDSLASGRAPAI